MAKKKDTVTLHGESPVLPEAPSLKGDAAAMQKFEEEKSAYVDAKIAENALNANSSEFPALEEPNLPHDREVLQNYTAPQVVTTDNGFGRVEGATEKEPSSTVILPEDIQAEKQK